MHRLTIIGIGSWGTALALHLARNGHHVTVWDRNQERLQLINSTRHHPSFLSEYTFPENIHIAKNLASALTDRPEVVVAVPSQGFADCLRAMQPFLPTHAHICWGSKGLIEGKLLHQVAREILGETAIFAVLSGPTFAAEVAKGLPTALTIAAEKITYANELCKIFWNKNFRPYASEDVIGVEIGGVVKNVLAIAIGISDAMGYGANARAALITRGLAEMVRLGIKLGGKSETFYGLAGLGDLILTATDNQSRNRRFGLALGEGLAIDAALAQIGQVVEGVRNTKEIYQLAQSLSVDMPITTQVYAVLYNHKPTKEAVESLLVREVKSEY